MNKLFAFWGRRNWFTRVALLFAIACLFNWTRLALTSGFPKQSEPGWVGEQTARESKGEPRASAPKTGLTMERYAQLQPGMSYSKAVVILGEEGQELSSNEIAGNHTVMYQWEGRGMGNMNAMFQNDKLISKAQFGLQ